MASENKPRLVAGAGGPAPGKKQRQQKKSKKKATRNSTNPAPPPWHRFVEVASDPEARQRILEDLKGVLERHKSIASKYCCLGVLDPEGSITSFNLDQIFRGLSDLNENRDKNIALFLYSRGGSIESAYQISKICRSFAKERFIVVVPREAKSAATLLALGADEVHVGPLGQLGPIDPQLGGLPALGVVQALKAISSLAAQNPDSSEMFARYLRMALTVEQIGYCERIGESAAQYATRLLQTKPALAKKAKETAHYLVHEYKHHGFVIDVEEATKLLGKGFIKQGTDELRMAEDIYSSLDVANLFLRLNRDKYLAVIGRLDELPFMLERQR